MCPPVNWSCHVRFIEGQLGTTSVRMNCTAQYSDVMYFGLDGPACWPSSRRRIDRVRYRQLCTSANQGTNRLGWYYLILGSSSKASLAGNAIETSSKHSGPNRILQRLKPRVSSARSQSSVTELLGGNWDLPMLSQRGRGRPPWRIVRKEMAGVGI